MQKENMEWICCPIFGGKTSNMIRKDIILKNYPLYCPKCKQETLINAKRLHITLIKEPDAQSMNLRDNFVTHRLFFHIA